LKPETVIPTEKSFTQNVYIRL